jgi:hypothetical protein
MTILKGGVDGFSYISLYQSRPEFLGTSARNLNLNLILMKKGLHLLKKKYLKIFIKCLKK